MAQPVQHRRAVFLGDIQAVRHLLAFPPGIWALSQQQQRLQLSDGIDTIEDESGDVLWDNRVVHVLL